MQYIWVTPDAAGVRAARGHAARTMDRLGVRDADREVLLVLVSELLTNAVMHGVPPITLAIGSRADGCRIEVSDASTTPPWLRTGDQASGGHGLHLVDRLATAWGTEPTTIGKFVWLELRGVLPRPTIEEWTPTRVITPPRIATPA
ncbi:ATP-binding protein [Serinibacter salmoneus]|uniref:Histidine kinase-like protein n=1 Tax=Serinibacter salmoneus TaxID=556530 RepID=A0A2A9D4A4_9MICO|nr:ATP-binding protein [Serinibacter salmoneus]PFG21085.1 histidine kinase-like protein [Serinibacter salmoneus]